MKLAFDVRRRVYWLPRDIRTAIASRGTSVAMYFGDSVGDNLLCTAVLRERLKQNGSAIAMLTRFPDLFLHNPSMAKILPGDVGLIPSLQRLGKSVLLPRYTSLLADNDREVPPKRHIVAEMCASIGLAGEVELQPEIFLTEAELARGRIADKQIAMISAGAGAFIRMRNKEWPADRFQTLAGKLQKQQTVIQLGTKEDPPISGAVDLRGRTSLREAAAILSQSECYIGLSGMLKHLARAVNCPAVIIYGGRETPEITGYTANENLYSPVPCAPCWQRNRCDYERKCLQLITVDDVLQGLTRLRQRPRGMSSERATL